jgi:hypothetical protein
VPPIPAEAARVREAKVVEIARADAWDYCQRSVAAGIDPEPGALSYASGRAIIDGLVETMPRMWYTNAFMDVVNYIAKEARIADKARQH